MTTARHHIRPLLCALGILMLAILLPATQALAQDVSPGDGPGFYDPDGVYDDAQYNTLAHDAELLQSSNIPTLVITRVSDPDAAAEDQAKASADHLRQEWQDVGGPDASLSLVILYSHVPKDGAASSIVASWGDHTFDASGLTPDYIESVLARDPRALLDQGHPFEALVYAVRELRYGGIYFPPAPAPLSGARQVLHDVLTWISPVAAVATIVALIAATLRPDRILRRTTAISAGAVAILFTALSIFGENRIGIASVLAIVATFGVTGWIWTHSRASISIESVRRALPDLLLALLFFLVSLSANVDAIPTTPTHPDESRWLNRAYYARDLGDPFGPTWQDYVTTRGQPPLGSIVMGIGLAVQGKALDSVNVWDFAYGRDWNTRMGAMPSDEIREAGRRTNAFIGALVVATVYILGRLLTNRVGGAIGALFLAFHPLHIMLSTQALSDETLALLLGFIFLTGWWFAKSPTWTRAILLGVLLGLGGAVKLTPLLLAAPLAGFGVLRLLLDRDRPARDYALKMVLQPVFALVTFIAIYPYLWSAPIRRTWDLYAFRASEMDDQGAAWPDAAVSSPLDALGRFGDYLAHNSTSRRMLGPLANLFGFEKGPAGLDYIPAVAGLLILIWWVAKRGFWTPNAMLALLMGAEAATLIFGMKTDFYRYHLPITVIMAICITVSTGVAWSALTRLVTSTDIARHHHAPAQAATMTEILEPRQ